MRSVRLSQRTRCPGTRFGGTSSSSLRDRTVGVWVSASQLLALKTRDNAAGNTTRRLGRTWDCSSQEGGSGSPLSRGCHGQSVAASAKALLLACNVEPWRKASFASWAEREKTAKSRPVKYAPDPAAARCPSIRICNSPMSALRQEGRGWTDSPSILSPIHPRSCASLSFCASSSGRVPALTFLLFPIFSSWSSHPPLRRKAAISRSQPLISSPALSPRRPLSQPQQ